jgi:glutamine synthetase
MNSYSDANWQSGLPAAFTQWLDGRRIEEIESIVPDMAGVARGKAFPAKKFSLTSQSFLPISIFYLSITGTYIEEDDENEDWITEADMVLKPDLSTASAVPWAEDPTMQVINDLELTNGNPVAIAPRSILKRIIAAYREAGWEPVIAPEMEFYLTSPNVDPNYPVEPPIGRTGRKGIGRQAYSIAAVDEYGAVIDDIYAFSEAQGLGIDAITQEGGAGQIEINLQHGDPLELADHVFYFKRTIREAALKNNCFATFMAKPMKFEPGSAMHIHQSVLDAKTGKNVFTDDNGEPTELFDGMVAGLQSYLPNVLLLLAPYVNSYRRFKADDAAPINFEWGVDNRTAGIRVPISGPEGRRVENRVVGMDCNPYLAIAANLACGYLGMTQKLKPTNANPGIAYERGVGIPNSLNEALRLFTVNNDVRTLLGKEFCAVYERIKMHELNEFLSEISAWEREHLLLSV